MKSTVCYAMPCIGWVAVLFTIAKLTQIFERDKRNYNRLPGHRLRVEDYAVRVLNFIMV